MSSKEENLLIDIFPSLGVLKKRLEQGVPPLIGLIGTEPYQKRTALHILEEVLNPSEWNKDQFMGDSVRSDVVRVSLVQVPFMSLCRLVILKHVEQASKEVLAELISYLENPCPSTCFVIIGDQVDLRLKFFATLKEKGLYIELDPISAQKIPRFIQRMAAKRGLVFEPGAVTFLADETKGDIDALEDAVQKCASYVAPRLTITLQDAAFVLGVHAEQSAFALIDAICAGHVAQTAMMTLRMKNEPPMKTLALLARQIRLMGAAIDLSDNKKVSWTELAKILKIQPFVASKLLQQTKMLTSKHLRVFHELLYQVEKRIRTTSIDTGLLLEQFILELVHAVSDLVGKN